MYQHVFPMHEVYILIFVCVLNTIDPKLYRTACGFEETNILNLHTASNFLSPMATANWWMRSDVTFCLRQTGEIVLDHTGERELGLHLLQFSEVSACNNETDLLPSL